METAYRLALLCCYIIKGPQWMIKSSFSLSRVLSKQLLSCDNTWSVRSSNWTLVKMEKKNHQWNVNHHKTGLHPWVETLVVERVCLPYARDFILSEVRVKIHRWKYVKYLRGGRRRSTSVCQKCQNVDLINSKKHHSTHSTLSAVCTLWTVCSYTTKKHRVLHPTMHQLDLQCHD